MDLVELAEVVKLAANIGSAALLGVVVLYLSRMRDRDEQRDAEKDKAYIGLLNSMSNSFNANTSRLDEQTAVLASITRTLTETNPQRYGEMKAEILNAIGAVPEEVAGLLPPQFDALKATVESSVSGLAQQLVARLDKYDTNALAARTAIQVEADAALQRIGSEIDRLAEIAANIDRMTAPPAMDDAKAVECESEPGEAPDDASKEQES